MDILLPVCIVNLDSHLFSPGDDRSCRHVLFQVIQSPKDIETAFLCSFAFIQLQNYQASAFTHDTLGAKRYGPQVHIYKKLAPEFTFAKARVSTTEGYDTSTSYLCLAIACRRRHAPESRGRELPRPIVYLLQSIHT